MTADSDPPLEALAMQSSSGAAASTSNHQGKFNGSCLKLVRCCRGPSISSFVSRATSSRHVKSAKIHQPDDRIPSLPPPASLIQRGAAGRANNNQHSALYHQCFTRAYFCAPSVVLFYPNQPVARTQPTYSHRPFLLCSIP